MFEDIIQFIQTNVHLAPYVSFSLLLLAGLNLPVSEDVMVFINAVLAKKNPDHVLMLYMGVFWGAWVSDLIAYWLGRLIGPKLWSIKWFANMVSVKRISKISNFFDKYGFFTLLVGRFLPGVRNTLFISAGLAKMNFGAFALADFFACIMTVSLYFTLYYQYGEKAIEFISKGNWIILSVFGGALLIWFILKRKKQKNLSNMQSQ